MNIKIKLSIALVMSLLLVACGGGGGGKPVKVWKLVKEVTTNGADGSTSSIVTNDYENGFLIRQDHDEDANGQIDHISDSYVLYGYSDGVLSKKTSYRASGSKYVERLIEQGRSIETISYDENGLISGTSHFVNSYDDKKRIIKEEFSHNGGDVQRVIVFTYEGNIETWKYDLDMDGETDDVTFIFTHNDRGELIKKERYNISQDLTRTEDYTYEYDENNNIQTKTILINGNNGGVITYTWEQRSVPEINAK